MKKKTFAVLAAATLAATPAGAALVLPAATMNVSYSVKFQGAQTYGSTMTGDGSQRIGVSSSAIDDAIRPFGAASADISGAPILSAIANSNRNNFVETRASADFTYYFGISGSDSSIVIPVHYIARLVTTGYMNGDAVDSYARLTVNNMFGQQQQYNARSCYVNAPCNSGYGSESYIENVIMVHVNTAVLVSGFAQSYAYGRGYGSAWVDPYFYIDPDFISSHPGYNLSFSEFAGNDAPVTAGVPEPAAWATMIAGFALLGGAMRRRNVPRSPAAA